MNEYKTFAELAAHLGIDPNNPTYEGQQKVLDWLRTNEKSASNPNGYERGYFTNKYLNAQTEVPPSNTPALTPAEQYQRQQTDAQAHAAQQQAPVDPNGLDSQETQQQTQQTTKPVISPKEINENIQKVGGSVLAGWTPIVASGLSNTRDPSSQAAGWRDQAALYAQNAAENAKILQWNKQRATDNTLADKIAAAQAHEKWQQNAASAGAEGSAGALAGMATNVTPDKMAEKQFQQTAMDTATKNQAEVNRNKLEASAANTDANVKDWQVNYNQQLDAEASNLAQANAAKKKDTVEKKDTTEKKDTEETTDKPDTKVEDTTKSAAPSNQASDVTQDATTQTAADKEMSDIITRATQIVEGFKNGEVTSNQASVEQEYEQLKQKYQALIDKGVISNPPEFPFMETAASLNEKQEPENSTQSIANTLSGLKI